MAPGLLDTTELPLELSLRAGERTALLDHADHAGLHVAVGKEQPPGEVLERGTEVLEVIGVEERIADRIDVREDDAEVHEEVVHLAARAERHHAVDGVEREPADDEEEHDAREILRGLDLSLARRAKYAQHRTARLMSAAGQPTTETQTGDATDTAATAATSAAAAAAAVRLHRDDLL